jgi:hypothetical protein
MSTSHGFGAIQFGFSSAEAESSEDPGLLLEGYHEIHNAFEAALNSSKFLFLGYKGSGKSAIGERLQLMSKSDPQMFVQKWIWRIFPLHRFQSYPRRYGAGVKISNSLVLDSSDLYHEFVPKRRRNVASRSVELYLRS